MSADNGIYILVTRDKYKRVGRYVQAVPEFTAYRVAHAFAVDDLEYLQLNEPYNVGCYLLEVWGKSKVYDNIDEVCKAAKLIEACTGRTEYGIRFIDTAYNFYVK